MTGSPRVTVNPLLGCRVLKLKALAVIRWQPLQWHAIVIKGSELTSNCTCPHLHWPTFVVFLSGMVYSLTAISFVTATTVAKVVELNNLDQFTIRGCGSQYYGESTLECATTNRHPEWMC